MLWGYDPDFNSKVCSRVSEANPEVTPILVGEASLDALSAFVGEGLHFSYVFSDSDDHNYDLIKAENAVIIPRLLKGGIICFHDFGNYAPPVKVYEELLRGGGFEEVIIPWGEIKAFVSSGNLEEGNNSWHCCQVELPCFVAALRKL